MGECFIGNVRFPEERPSPGTIIFDANFESVGGEFKGRKGLYKFPIFKGHPLNLNNCTGEETAEMKYIKGNLGRVDMINECEYDLFVRPDTCNPRHRVWFYFAVENALPNQRVVFNVVNFSKLRTLFDTASAAPVARCCTQMTWSRIPAKHLYYYRSAVHADRFVLSFAFIFDSAQRYEFAYCIPYTYTDLQNLLTEIDSRGLRFFSRDILTLSVQRRKVDLVTITEASLYTRQKVVFITARVHPGETPSSFVIKGIIEYLISDDERAKRLRSEYVFKLVPMLNPDGVYLGNYRCSLMGSDLNRHWQAPSQWAQPTIYATKNLLLRYNANPVSDILIIFIYRYLITNQLNLNPII
uniref:Cytosolic carboxypeptidase 6 n=1 Tax=Ascaris lumbricoides TaxID=6252 RepID=A0A0M3IEG8_ASCLU